MVAQNIDYFKSKPANIPKITVMVDHGYHPDKLIPALEEIYPQIMTKIRFKAAPSRSRRKRLWVYLGLWSFLCVGLWNVPMLGWIVVKVWSKTLNQVIFYVKIAPPCKRR
nr:hypothetical protein [Pseudanabaena sp. SR411]